MEVRYTKHARYIMKERGIDGVWIEETLKRPDKIEKEFGKNYASKKLNGVSIEVVYEKKSYINVITVYWI